MARDSTVGASPTQRALAAQVVQSRTERHGLACRGPRSGARAGVPVLRDAGEVSKKAPSHATRAGALCASSIMRSVHGAALAESQGGSGDREEAAPEAAATLQEADGEGSSSSGGSGTASANHAKQGTSTGGGGDSEQSRKPPFVLQLLTPEEEFTHAR